MELARRQAIRSSFIKRVGVVFVKGRKIIVQGYNKVSSPKYLNFEAIDGFMYWSLHAECDALGKGISVKGSTVYLYGFKTRICQARPCPLCERHLRLRGVERAVFTTERGVVEEIDLTQALK